MRAKKFFFVFVAFVVFFVFFMFFFGVVRAQAQQVAWGDLVARHNVEAPHVGVTNVVRNVVVDDVVVNDHRVEDVDAGALVYRNVVSVRGTVGAVEGETVKVGQDVPHVDEVVPAVPQADEVVPEVAPVPENVPEVVPEHIPVTAPEAVPEHEHHHHHSVTSVH